MMWGRNSSSEVAALVFSGSQDTLDGVTADSELDLADYSYGNYVHIANGLTLNHVAVRLGNASGSTYGQLYFDNTETLGGTGTVVFGKFYANAIYSNGSGNTLTIGPGITVRGSNGTLCGPNIV